MDLSITMLSAAILIAASSNNVAKAIYAIAFGGKSSRRPALVLVVLALLGFAAAAVYILRVPPDRLSDVLITEQLHRRVPHNADYKREKLAIQELAQQMVDHPEGLMPGLVRLAIEACDAQSAGISLYEPDPPGPGIFRWHHLAGHFANLSGGTIPRDFSPSGIAIDQGVPILMARPERFYAYLARAGVPLCEALLRACAQCRVSQNPV